MNSIPALIHIAGFASFAFAIYYDAFVLNLPERVRSKSQSFGGLGKYLTFLNMCLQCIFFFICLLADFTSRNSSINKIKDIIFAGAAFPIGIFVGVIFWSLWAVDRELIFPKVLDEVFPSWLNHLMHTTVLPLQLAELYFSSHRYPSRVVGGGITSLLTLGYLVWIHVIYYFGGFWVYPVFRVLDNTTRPPFMALCCAMGLTFYFIGEKLNAFIWKNENTKTSAKQNSYMKSRKAKKDI